MLNPKPSMGRIVIVTLPIHEQRYPNEVAPAIVTQAEGYFVWATAFPQGRHPLPLPSATYDERESEPNTWRWPPRL